MKWRNYKSKIGMVLAGVYLLVCVRVLAAHITDPFATSILLIDFLKLTSPIGIALFFIFLGIARPENGVYISFIFVFIGGAINTLVLYFLGYLLTRLLMFMRKTIPEKTVERLDHYKSKVGTVLASVYLLVLILGLVEFVTVTNLSHSWLVRPVLFIITMPVSLAVASIFFFLSLDTPTSMYDRFIGFFVGGVINTIALYFLGYLLTKKLSLKKRFVSLKKALWKR